jgi:hypothetical protein
MILMLYTQSCLWNKGLSEKKITQLQELRAGNAQLHVQPLPPLIATGQIQL